MRAGITVQVMLPGASVAFQSQVDVEEGSVRKVSRELQPGELWTWRLGVIQREKIAVLAGQSREIADVSINGVETLIEGQQSTDFGIFYARRFDETIGTLPFDGDLSEIRILNKSTRRNTISFVVAEIAEPPVIVARKGGIESHGLIFDEPHPIGDESPIADELSALVTTAPISD